MVQGMTGNAFFTAYQKDKNNSYTIIFMYHLNKKFQYNESSKKNAGFINIIIFSAIYIANTERKLDNEIDIQ